MEIPASLVENIAALALGLDTVIEVGQDAEGHYLYRGLLDVLEDVGVVESDLRGAAEEGIHAYLYGQVQYIRKLVKDRLEGES